MLCQARPVILLSSYPAPIVCTKCQEAPPADHPLSALPPRLQSTGLDAFHHESMLGSLLTHAGFVPTSQAQEKVVYITMHSSPDY